MFVQIGGRLRPAPLMLQQPLVPPAPSRRCHQRRPATEGLLAIRNPYIAQKDTKPRREHTRHATMSRANEQANTSCTHSQVACGSAPPCASWPRS